MSVIRRTGLLRPLVIRQAMAKKMALFALLVLPLGDRGFARQSIVTLTPQTTELLFQLGFERQIVGTTWPNFYPREARNLPLFGTAFSPNIEKLALAKPDLIVGDTSVETSFEFGRLGSEFLKFNSNSLEDLYENVRKLTKGENGPELQCLEALILRPQARSFSFLAFLSMNPPIIFGKQSYLSQLIEALGGENIAPSGLVQGYPQVGADWVAFQTPDRYYALSYEGGLQDRPFFVNGDTEMLPLPENYFSRLTLGLLEGVRFLKVQLPKECQGLNNA